MQYPADYHMHTPLCRHATGEPQQYVARALQLGLTEIGFSDHSPMQDDDFDNWRMRLDQLEVYVEKVRQVQQDFPKLTIRLGLEVDYIPGYEEWIQDLAGRYPWDYFIGSVHYVTDDWDVDNPAKKHEWKGRDPDEVWGMYFERLVRAAESELFDFIGHPDLPKKFNIYPRRDAAELFKTFLKAARKENVPFEINTAGLRKECAEIYPSARFLQMALECGVSITFGSDAHAPEEVGYHFADAVELARRVGFTHWCRFAGRRGDHVALT
jgi:histidinol-phosphatase (PHP family)